MISDRSAARWRDQASEGLQLRRAPAAWLLLLLVAGCGPRLDLIEQVRVFAGRPPLAALPDVPGADRPFPNLGTVPARPVPPSREERRRVAEALVADRENARHVGVPRPPPAAIPPTAAAEAAGPLGFQQEGEIISGIVSPNPAVVGPRSVPPIAGAPSAAVATSARQGEAPPSAAVEGASSPLPETEIPSAPPPPARLEPEPAPIAAPRSAEPSSFSARSTPASVPSPAPLMDLSARSAAATAASDPSVVIDRSALPAAATQVALRAGGIGAGAAIRFAAGSAILAPSERDTLIALARTRGAAALRVIGFVDAAGEELGLALARAQAVAQALRAAGVPAEAIEIAAEARPSPAGRGAEVRLIY